MPSQNSTLLWQNNRRSRFAHHGIARGWKYLQFEDNVQLGRWSRASFIYGTQLNDRILTLGQGNC